MKATTNLPMGQLGFLQKGDSFIFNGKTFQVKQKFSDWKKCNEPYLFTTSGETFYHGELEVEVIKKPKKKNED